METVRGPLLDHHFWCAFTGEADLNGRSIRRERAELGNALPAFLEGGITSCFARHPLGMADASAYVRRRCRLLDQRYVGVARAAVPAMEKR